MDVAKDKHHALFGTANFHRPWGEHLIRCGHRVVLVSGVAAHENRKTLDGRWDTNLRYALYQAALIASIRDRHFIVYFANRLGGREKEPGIKTKIVGQVGGQTFEHGWTLKKKKEPFNPDYLKIA